MMKRQLAENFLAFGGEREQDLPAIFLGARAVDESSGLEAVYQLNGAVVADLHAGRQFPNPRPHPSRHALDREHELILAALQPRFLDLLLAEVKEAANLVAELRQRLIIRQGELLHCRRLYRAAIQ